MTSAGSPAWLSETRLSGNKQLGLIQLVLFIMISAAAVMMHAGVMALRKS